MIHLTGSPNAPATQPTLHGRHTQTQNIVSSVSDNIGDNNSPAATTGNLNAKVNFIATRLNQISNPLGINSSVSVQRGTIQSSRIPVTIGIMTVNTQRSFLSLNSGILSSQINNGWGSSHLGSAATGGLTSSLVTVTGYETHTTIFHDQWNWTTYINPLPISWQVVSHT